MPEGQLVEKADWLGKGGTLATEEIEWLIEEIFRLRAENEELIRAVDGN